MNSNTITGFNIKTPKDEHFYFGQKLFAVVRVGSEYFNEPCPVCNGEKKVVINDIECPCPYCTTSSHNGTHLQIGHYKVIDIYVNQIQFYGPSTKNVYSSQQKALAEQWCEYQAFFQFKSDAGHKEEYRSKVSPSDLIKNVKDEFKTPEAAKKHWGKPLFLRKGDAEYFANLLNTYGYNQLQKFNAEHKTEYLYPWTQ